MEFPNQINRKPFQKTIILSSSFFSKKPYSKNFQEIFYPKKCGKNQNSLKSIFFFLKNIIMKQKQKRKIKQKIKKKQYFWGGGDQKTKNKKKYD